MKIRLHGTEEECRETAELLENVMLLQSVSDPYPDRGRSVLVRVYIEAIPQTTRGAACSGCAGEPEDDHWRDYNYSCSSCSGQIGMFTGREGWHHYRGEGTAASPVEIYDAGHEATLADPRPGGAS